jgi:hypothetical protein
MKEYLTTMSYLDHYLIDKMGNGIRGVGKSNLIISAVMEFSEKSSLWFEQAQWIDDNIGKVIHIDRFEWVFEDEIDAVAFKLRWC